MLCYVCDMIDYVANTINFVVIIAHKNGSFSIKIGFQLQLPCSKITSVNACLEEPYNKIIISSLIPNQVSRALNQFTDRIP